MKKSRTEDKDKAAGLSKARIIDVAVDILDREGTKALTFRELTARLATGNGAIYWYVKSREELLTAATEYVVAIALDKLTADAKPRAALRALAMSIFDTVDDHPWVYQQLINPPWSTATLRLFEKIGRELQTLGVAENLEFTAASALLHYVLGAAGQNVANTSSVPEGADRTTFLSVTADEWNKLDPAQFAFVRHLAEQLPYHDDRDQFLAGVNLVLAGISAEPGGEA